MEFSSHTPRGALGKYVQNFWQCSDAPSHPKERILPSGTVEFVFNLLEDEVRIFDPTSPDQLRRLPGAVVSGTYSRPFVIDPSQHASMMGVHFRPGGAFPFLGIEACELADHHIPLKALWGIDADILRENLCVASTSSERFRVMENALEVRLLHSTRHHPAVTESLKLLGGARLDESIHRVADRLGLSQRRFIQLFKRQVGLTPKLYSRVLRFQEVRTLADQLKPVDWSRLALACGYCDQSHLIHDFQEFSSLSPTEYVSARSSQVLKNHVPILA